MPQVTKRINASYVSTGGTGDTTQGKVQFYYQMKPNSGMTFNIPATGPNPYYYSESSVVFQNLSQLIYASSLSLHVHMLNSWSNMGSCLKGTPMNWVEACVNGGVIKTQYDSLGSDTSIDLSSYLSTIKNASLVVNYSVIFSSYSYQNDDKVYAQQAGPIGYQIDTNLQNSYLEYTVLEPSVSGVAITGLDVTGNIVCSWSPQDVQACTVQVIQSGAVVATKTGITGTSCTFIPGDIAHSGETTFRVIASGNGATDEASTTVTLTAPQAMSSDFTVNHTKLDAPTTCTWTQVNTTSWTMQVIKSGGIIATKSGTTATGCTFGVGELPEGKVTFRLTCANQWNSGHVDEVVTLVAPVAGVSNVSVVGMNIDNTISCTAAGENVYNWTVQAIQNGEVKVSKSGTGNTISAVFVGGELRQAVATTFRFIYSNTWNGSSVDQNIALTRTEPTIIALEPSGINANKDGVITCSWTSSNQQSFSLVIDGNTYTGTTQSSISIPTNTIKTLGTKSLKLTIYYTSSWGETRSTTMSVTFNAVGTPSTPLLDGYSFYSVAEPTFTWTCADAFTVYRVQVLNANNAIVDDSGDVVSSMGSYKCTTTLENSTTYKVQVKVKTQYGYWSAWVGKTFTTNFVVANKPSIEVFVGENSIVVNSFTVYSVAFDHCDIYRRTQYSPWVRIAYNLDNSVSYTDSYVGKEKYYYKVTSVSTQGGKNDSDTAEATLNVVNFNFASLESLHEQVEFIGDPEVEIETVRATTETTYDGVPAPIVDIGEQDYQRGTCQFTVTKDAIDHFKSVVKTAKVLLYRDGRGNKIYCQIVGNLKPHYISGNNYILSFSFVEVPFEEKDMYSGTGNLHLVFWDGTYKWDGSITWDAEASEYVEPE